MILGIGASWYVVLVGALLASISKRYVEGIDAASLPPLEKVIENAFGYWSVLPLFTALLAGWVACESRFAARVLAGTSLLFLLVCFDPYAYGLWVHHIMGGSAFWRLMWAIPLPLMLAVLLQRLLAESTNGRALWLKVGVFVLATAMLAWSANEVGTLRAANHATLGVPRVKAPRADYALARMLMDKLPESSSLLAPVSIASWCSTFVRHPQLLSVRPMYLLAVSRQLGKEETARRYALQLYVSGWNRDPKDQAMMKDAIERYKLGAVVVAASASWLQEINGVLRAAGYRKQVVGDYVIWWRI